MTTHEILYDAKPNENADSARVPVGVYVPGSVDLTETVTQCANWDFDMLVQNTRYEVLSVELPEWLSPTEWLRNTIEWKYLWALKGTKELPEATQRMLLGFQGVRRYVVAKLFTTNLRSEFRMSLRSQIETWFSTPYEERKHDSPLSRRQWEVLVTERDKWAYENLSRNIYYASRYREIV